MRMSCGTFVVCSKRAEMRMSCGTFGVCSKRAEMRTVCGTFVACSKRATADKNTRRQDDKTSCNWQPNRSQLEPPPIMCHCLLSIFSTLKTRSFARFNSSVFFARRANFSAAGEAENRRLMVVRVTAVELLSSVALAQEDARTRCHSRRHQSPVRAIRLRQRFRAFRVKPPQGQAPFQSF